MSTVNELFHQAMTLPADQRAALARDLIVSPESEGLETDVDQAWSDEVNRRADAFAAGQTTAVDWRESIERMRMELKQRQSP